MNLKEKFHKYLPDILDENKCWEWKGAINYLRGGYGIICHNKKTLKAHRVSYELHRGVIPDGQVVRHMCDNKLCVNPEHLQIGSVSDNNRDKIGKHLYIAVKPEKYNEAVALMKKMGYYGHLTNK
mgnify:CR=1 FL=1